MSAIRFLFQISLILIVNISFLFGGIKFNKTNKTINLTSNLESENIYFEYLSLENNNNDPIFAFSFKISVNDQLGDTPFIKILEVSKSAEFPHSDWKIFTNLIEGSKGLDTLIVIMLGEKNILTEKLYDSVLSIKYSVETENYNTNPTSTINILNSDFSDCYGNKILVGQNREENKSLNITFYNIENSFQEFNKVDSFILDQNYPNPFNPLTNISFILEKESEISLMVTDILGNNVIQLEDGYLSKGKYSYLVDGNNLASGFYYYTLSVNNHTSTKKMLLLK